MRRSAALLLTLLLAAALLVTGCGSSSSSSGSEDPAKALPATTLLFASVQVRPEGDAKSGAEAAGRKVLAGKEVGPELQKLVNRGLKRQGIDYGEDIEPWLGRRAAFAITGYNGTSQPDVLLAVNSKDDDKAADFVKKAAKGEPKKTYKDVEYYTSSSSNTGVTDGFVLLGTTPAAFRAGVDALKGGASLGGSGAFENATSKVTTDGLGLFFVDTKRFINVLGQTSQGAAALQQLQTLPQFRDLKPTAAALTADGDAIRLESPAPGNADETTAGAVADLPANSWIALSAPKAGNQIRTQLETLPANQRQQFEQVKRLLREQTGLDLDRDVLGWIKGFSLFATGTTLPDLKVGLVVGSSDPGASRRALGKIAGLVARQGGARVRRTGDGFQLATPQGPVSFSVTGDKVLIGFGKDLEGALGGDTLEGSDTYAEAQKALGGGKPAFLVSVPTIVQLAQNFGAGSDSSFQQAQRYLKAFGAITSGVVDSGGKKVARLAVGLR